MKSPAPFLRSLHIGLALILVLGSAHSIFAQDLRDNAISISTRTGGTNSTMNATTNSTVDVLFYFGDGNYTWGNAIRPTQNSTAFDFTLAAAGSSDLPMNWTNSTYGAFITKIGEKETPEDFSEFWNLYIWNVSASIWVTSLVGASLYYITGNTTIAWAFDRWDDAPPIPSPLNPNPDLIPVDVLIDFGNGTYEWEDVILFDSFSSAFNATEYATQEAGLTFEYDTFPFGNMVTKIEDTANAEDFSLSWLLWLWNESSEEWEYAQVGSSDLTLVDGDVIAWQYDNWGDSPPVPSPYFTYPNLIKVDVLVDFGNGTYFWEDAIVPRDFPQIYITTEMVGFEHALEITWIGMGCAGCSVWINIIGGNKTLSYDSQDWKWRLWDWDGSSKRWTEVEEIFEANLSSGSIIAWEYSWPLSEGPDPSPIDRYTTINLPPRVGILKTIGLEEGETTNITIPATDPEMTELIYELEEGPEFVSIDEASGQLLISEGAQPGKYPITIIITDSDPTNPKSALIETKVIISELEEDTSKTDTEEEGLEPDLFLIVIVIGVTIIIMAVILLSIRKKKKE